MKNRLLLLIPVAALALAGMMAMAAWTRGANDATPTPVPPSPTVAATATAAPATATPAVPATNTPLPVATQAQPTAPALPVAPSATPAGLPPTPTIASPLPTPSAPTSPLSAPKAETTPAAPPAAPAILTSSASLAINGQMVSYSYPSGWALKQSTNNQQTVATIEGPEGAFVSLTVYGADSSPAQLSAAHLDALKKQAGSVSATPLATTVNGVPAEGYTVKFSSGGVPTTGVILSLRGGRSAVTLYTQAADADLSVMQARFDVVKNTLVVR